MYPSSTSNNTSLGLPEIVERVGAYLFFWVSAILLLIFERRNQNVRQHAWQSLIIFGTLSAVGFVLSVLGGVFGVLPLIGWLLAAPFRFLGGLDYVVAVILWIVLMVGAAMNPNFQLPGTQRVKKMIR